MHTLIYINHFAEKSQPVKPQISAPNEAFKYVRSLIFIYFHNKSNQSGINLINN